MGVTMSESAIPQVTGTEVTIEEGNSIAVALLEAGVIFSTGDIGLTTFQAGKITQLLAQVLYYS
jgi:hypothetical protein